MGWTEKDAMFFKNGKIDRKAECDYLWESCGNEGRFKVEKSTMVGSTYYAAVTICKKIVDGILVDIPENQRVTFGTVCLTSSRKEGRYTLFGYKDMDETCGPYAYDCPESILKLLTDTDSEFALNWREMCRKKATEKREAKKNPHTLNNLPIGAVIEWQGYRLVKHNPAYQFKRPFWKVENGSGYVPANRIKIYTVISM